MDEVTARATLVPSGGWEDGALVATVDRSQIESALAAEDAEPELLLDVMRTDSGAGAGETRRIAIGWERDELTQILAAETRDHVTFAIDPRSLAAAYDQADVEAHGLRQKAAVLTIAVATAAAGAASAQASMVAEAGGAVDSGLSGAYTTMENTRSELVGGAQQGAALGASYTAIENSRSELASRSAQEASTLGDAYTAAEASRAQLASQSAEEAATLGDAYTAAEASRAQLASQPTTGPADGALSSAYTAAENARADLIGTADDAVPVSSDDGISISAPDPATVGVGAGLVALGIAGAAFAARTRRREQLA